MIRVPTEIAIRAVELRIAQSKRNTQESLSRARVAFRANLIRPSTLTVAAGAAGLFGFWLARRPRTQAASASDGKRVPSPPSKAVIVRGFIMRYTMKALPLIWQQVRAAGQEQAARAHRETPKPQAEEPLTSGVRN